MRNKDYGVIAAVIKDKYLAAKGDEAGVLIAEMADTFSVIFAGQNSKFNRARFLVACGVN